MILISNKLESLDWDTFPEAFLEFSILWSIFPSLRTTRKVSAVEFSRLSLCNFLEKKSITCVFWIFSKVFSAAITNYPYGKIWEGV